MTADTGLFSALAESYAFIGNSLLSPMSQTSDVALDPEFWSAFEQLGDARVSECAASLRAWAEGVGGHNAAVQDVSVEFTRLFMGPPRPAAAPWESFYEGQERSYGFGDATFAMKWLLTSSGLELSNENNQYEDHMGIELLYLSVLCERAAGGDEGAARDADSFAREHPLRWVAAFRDAVQADSPDGYFARLLDLAEALMQLQLRTMPQANDCSMSS